MTKLSQGRRCISGGSHLKVAVQTLKTWEDHIFCRES